MPFSILNCDDLNNSPSPQMGRAGPQGPREEMAGTKTRSKSRAHGEGIHSTFQAKPMLMASSLERDNDMAAKEPLG